MIQENQIFFFLMLTKFLKFYTIILYFHAHSINNTFVCPHKILKRIEKKIIHQFNSII